MDLSRYGLCVGMFHADTVIVAGPYVELPDRT